MNSIEGRNHRTQGAGKGGAVIVVVDVVVVERTGKQKSSLSSASKPGNSRVTTGRNGRKKGGGALQTRSSMSSSSKGPESVEAEVVAVVGYKRTRKRPEVTRQRWCTVNGVSSSHPSKGLVNLNK